MQKPTRKPHRSYWSSGPCVKDPQWSLDALSEAVLHRSHRGHAASDRIRLLLQSLRRALCLPSDYRIAITPGSATGSMETALWNFLGPLPVRVHIWDVFSEHWFHDVHDQLKLPCQGQRYALYQHPVDGSFQFPNTHDHVFTWCGTTAGVCIGEKTQNNLLHASSSDNLKICDATAAVFAYPLPWKALDIVAFSFQKALGAESGLGAIVLSPKAYHRLQNTSLTWPIPRILRLKHNHKIFDEIFSCTTLNTPSMLLVEEIIHALDIWLRRGGLDYAIQARKQNYRILTQWVQDEQWIDFLTFDCDRSQTSVCLAIVDPKFQKLQPRDQWKFLHSMAKILESEALGYDILNHTKSIPCLRLWCGPTQQTHDLKDFLPWLSWAFNQAKIFSF